MIFFAITLIFKPLRFLLDVLYAHIKAHHFAQDTIKDCASLDEMLSELSDQSPSLRVRIRKNVHYLVAFVSLVILDLDNIRVMYNAGFKYNSTGLPELFTHKIYPRELWLQGDVVANIGSQTIMLVMALLTLAPPLDPRYCLYAVRDPEDGRIKIYANGKGMVSFAMYFENLKIES